MDTITGLSPPLEVLVVTGGGSLLDGAGNAFSYEAVDPVAVNTIAREIYWFSGNGSVMVQSLDGGEPHVSGLAFLYLNDSERMLYTCTYICTYAIIVARCMYVCFTCMCLCIMLTYFGRIKGKAKQHNSTRDGSFLSFQIVNCPWWDLNPRHCILWTSALVTELPRQLGGIR